MLNQNGKLIVLLPNIMHYNSRIQLLLGNFNYKDSGVWDYTHFRWYTFKSGRDLLEYNGFKVVKAYVSGDIPFLSVFKFLPNSLRQNVYKILSNISEGFFGGQLIYVAKKK